MNSLTPIGTKSRSGHSNGENRERTYATPSWSLAESAKGTDGKSLKLFVDAWNVLVTSKANKGEAHGGFGVFNRDGEDHL